MKEKIFKVSFSNHEFRLVWIVWGLSNEEAIGTVSNMIINHCNKTPEKTRNYLYNEIVSRKQLCLIESEESANKDNVIYEFFEEN